MQDHLAERSVGRLADPAASLQRFLVVEDEIHGLVATPEDWAADESLDPFGDGGFEIHNDSARIEPMMVNGPMSFPFPKINRKSHAKTAVRVR
jgi:hypothetical protein